MGKSKAELHTAAIADDVVLNKIYEFRTQKVMLDFHLSSLYGVENRTLKQVVKRKQNRFPDDFMFQLTKDEWRKLITICNNK